MGLQPRLRANLCFVFLIFSSTRAFLETSKTRLSDISIKESTLKFFTIGDWGIDPSIDNPRYRWGRYNQSMVAKQMGALGADVQPHFVLSLGDNFYQEGITSTTHHRWNTSYEDIFNHSSLFIPWYPVLGNHDYYGNEYSHLEGIETNDAATMSQINYTVADSNKSGRWKFPWYYYTQVFRVGGHGDDSFTVQIVNIDTMSLLPISEQGCHHVPGENLTKPYCNGESMPKKDEQLRWIEDTLRSSTADWLIVSGHHPIYSVGSHGLSPTGPENPSLAVDLDPLLSQYNVSAYFAGHDHLLQVLVSHAKQTHGEEEGVSVPMYGIGSAGYINGYVAGEQDKLDEVWGEGKTELIHASVTAGFSYQSLTKEHLEIFIVDMYGDLVYSETVANRRK